MSITIRLARRPCVIRADGTLSPECRVAPIITDGMIPTERVALVRAQAFLDANGERRVPVSGDAPAPVARIPGDIVEVLDGERGPYRAKLTAITYTVAIDADGRSVTADARYQLERLADDFD